MLWPDIDSKQATAYLNRNPIISCAQSRGEKAYCAQRTMQRSIAFPIKGFFGWTAMLHWRA